MALSRHSIEELKAIHKRETGETLTDDEAWEMGRRLLRAFAFVTRRQAPGGAERGRFDPRPV